MYPNLKLQLWKSGMRQNRLAQMLGLDEAIVSKIVNGLREPNPVIRRRIASLLGSDEGWLFVREDGTPARSGSPASAGSGRSDG